MFIRANVFLVRVCQSRSVSVMLSYHYIEYYWSVAQKGVEKGNNFISVFTEYDEMRIWQNSIICVTTVEVLLRMDLTMT